MTSRDSGMVRGAGKSANIETVEGIYWGVVQSTSLFGRSFLIERKWSCLNSEGSRFFTLLCIYLIQISIGEAMSYSGLIERVINGISCTVFQPNTPDKALTTVI